MSQVSRADWETLADRVLGAGGRAGDEPDWEALADEVLSGRAATATQTPERPSPGLPVGAPIDPALAERIMAASTGGVRSSAGVDPAAMERVRATLGTAAGPFPTMAEVAGGFEAGDLSLPPAMRPMGQHVPPRGAEAFGVEVGRTIAPLIPPEGRLGELRARLEDAPETAGAGSTAGQVVGNAAAGLLAMAFGPGGIALLSGAHGAGSARESLEAGDSTLAAAGKGGAEVVTEFLGLERGIKPLIKWVGGAPGLRRAIAGTLAAGGVETAEEQVNLAANLLIDVADGKMTLAEAVEEMGRQAPEVAKIAFLSGVLMGGVGGAASAVAQRVATRRQGEPAGPEVRTEPGAEEPARPAPEPSGVVPEPFPAPTNATPPVATEGPPVPPAQTRTPEASPPAPAPQTPASAVRSSSLESTSSVEAPKPAVEPPGVQVEGPDPTVDQPDVTVATPTTEPAPEPTPTDVATTGPQESAKPAATTTAPLTLPKIISVGSVGTAIRKQAEAAGWAVKPHIAASGSEYYRLTHADGTELRIRVSNHSQTTRDPEMASRVHDPDFNIVVNEEAGTVGKDWNDLELNLELVSAQQWRDAYKDQNLKPDDLDYEGARAFTAALVREGTLPKPVADMTRTELVAEAKRLGVLADGPRTNVALRERIEAARTQETPRAEEATTAEAAPEAAPAPPAPAGASEAKGTPRPRPGVSQRLWDAADRMERAAKERVRKASIPRGKNVGAALPPETIADYAIIGAAKILKGASKFGQWSRAMIEDFGESIRPSLRPIWTASRERVRLIQGGRRPAAVRRQARAATGQTDTSAEVGTTEARALRARLTAEERAARRAYREARREGRIQLRQALAAAREQATVRRREAVAEARQKSTDRAKAREAVGDGLRREARRLIEQHLPVGERGRFLSNVTNARTLGSLVTTIRKIEKRLAELDHADAVRHLGRAVRKAKRAKLRPEYAQAVERLTGGIDARSMTPATRRALHATAEFFAEHPEAPIPPQVVERLKRLDTRSVREMDADEVRDVADAVLMAVHLNKTKNQLIGRQRGRKRDDVAGRIASEMEARVPALRERRTVLQRLAGAPPEGNRRSTASTWLREGGTRPEVLMEHLSPELRQLVWEDVGVHAYHVENSLVWELRDALAAASEAAGLKMTQRMPQAGKYGRRGLEKWRNESVEIDTPDGPVSITRGEALWLHLSMRDPWNAALARRNGVTLTRIDRDIRINDAVLSRIDAAIGAEGRAIADHMFDQFNGRMKQLLNDAWVEVYGVEIAINPSYVPRGIDMTRADTGMDVMEQMARDAEATLTSWGHLRERIGSKAPLEVGDAFDAYINHVDHVSRLAAYLGPTSNVYAILGRADVKRGIIQRVGKVGYDRILAAVHMQTVRTADRSDGARKMRRGMRLAAASILGARVSTLMLNPSGIPISASYLPNGLAIMIRSIPAGAEWLAMRSRVAKLLREHSPYWRTRYEDFAFQATAGIATERSRFGGPGVSEIALKPLSKSDEFGAVVRGRMAELHVQENLGVKPDDAQYGELVAREWERLMFRGENTGHGMELSGFLAEGRRNPVFMSMVIFTSSVSKIYSAAMRSSLASARAVRQWRAGDHAGARASRQTAVGGLAAVAASTAWVTLVREFLKSMRGTDDDDALWRRGAKTYATELAALVPLLGPNLLAPALRVVLGEWSQARPSSLIDSVWVDAAKTLAGVYGAVAAALDDVVDADGEVVAARKLRSAADGAAGLIALRFGVPWGGLADIKRMLFNIFSSTDERAEIRRALRAYEDERSVTAERRMVFRAVLDDDDRLFRRAVERWRRARPNEPITSSDLMSVISGRYDPLLAARKKVELTPSQRAFVEGVEAEKREMARRLGNLVDRNRDVFLRSSDPSSR